MLMVLPTRIEEEASEAYVQRVVYAAMDAMRARGVELTNAVRNGWPRSYACRFIEPGLVHYADHGTVLVQKPALDSMLQSMVGKPVVNEVHKDVNPSVYASGEADGIMTRVWFNAEDGWYWGEFLVWDNATMLNCESPAYSVSCAYTINKIESKGGTHNNIPYTQEILGGEYTHLAVVLNPRYEGARIVYNTKGGSEMLKFLKMLAGKKEPIELKNAAAAVVEIDGKEVPVKELIALHNSNQPAPATTEKVGMDTLVEIDGKEVSVKDLAEEYRNSSRKNEEDEEKKKKEDEDRKNADDKAKKDKEEEERKNAEEEKKKKDEEEERKNAKGTQHFNALEKATSLRGTPQQAQIMTRSELANEGAKRYGSTK